MCASFSKTSSVAVASTAIAYIAFVTSYSCCAIQYAAHAVAPTGAGYCASQNICELYRLYANAEYDDCGFMHIHNWYSLSGKEQLDYRTEMLYYFYMAKGSMDGVM